MDDIRTGFVDVVCFIYVYHGDIKVAQLIAKNHYQPSLGPHQKLG